MTNNANNDEQWFDDLYRQGSDEHSPAELDALILQAASQNQRRRWPLFATAAVLMIAAGVLLNAPDSALSPASQSEVVSAPAQSGTLPGAKTTTADASPPDMEREMQASMETALAEQAGSHHPSADSLSDDAGDSDASREKSHSETPRMERAVTPERPSSSAMSADSNAVAAASTVTEQRSVDVPPDGYWSSQNEASLAANVRPSGLGRGEDRADRIYSDVAPDEPMANTAQPEFEAPVSTLATPAMAPESPQRKPPAQETAAQETEPEGLAGNTTSRDHAVEEVIVTGAMKRATGAGTTASIRGCPLFTFYLNSSEETLVELRQCSDGRWTLDPERKLCKRYLRVTPSELLIDGETLTWADGQAIACEDGRFNRPKPAGTR